MNDTSAVELRSVYAKLKNNRPCANKWGSTADLLVRVSLFMY